MRTFIFIFLTTFLFSCSDDKAQLVSEIEELTTVMKAEDFPSEGNISKVVTLYDKYITSYPDDPETYTYLELKAKYLAAANKFDAAIDVYDEIIAKYKEESKTADAMFMQAFIEENYIGDKAAAEARYKIFINTYPEHELADDAKFSMENLNLSDEEIFNKLIQMQADSVIAE